MEDIKQDNITIKIDFPALFKMLKAEKTIIGLWIFFATISGVLYAYIFEADNEFIAIGKIMPEIGSKPPNGMGGLFEVLKKYSDNIDMYNTEITRPDIYDEIISTKAFYNYLLSKTVENNKAKKLSFKMYCYTTLTPKNSFYLKEIHDSSNVNGATEYAYQRNIRERIVITTSRKNSLVSISVKMPDPVVAANIANFTIEYLIDYITQYRTEKARQELMFVENLLKTINKEDYPNDIYKSLSVSVIQLKIRIQEDTPILQVLEYAQIPLVNSNRSKLSIIIPFLFLGLIAGIIAAFIRNNYRVVYFNRITH